MSEQRPTSETPESLEHALYGHGFDVWKPYLVENGDKMEPYKRITLHSESDEQHRVYFEGLTKFLNDPQFAPIQMETGGNVIRIGVAAAKFEQFIRPRILQHEGVAMMPSKQRAALNSQESILRAKLRSVLFDEGYKEWYAYDFNGSMMRVVNFHDWKSDYATIGHDQMVRLAQEEMHAAIGSENIRILEGEFGNVYFVLPKEDFALLKTCIGERDAGSLGTSVHHVHNWQEALLAREAAKPGPKTGR